MCCLSHMCSHLKMKSRPSKWIRSAKYGQPVATEKAYNCDWPVPTEISLINARVFIVFRPFRFDFAIFCVIVTGINWLKLFFLTKWHRVYTHHLDQPVPLIFARHSHLRCGERANLLWFATFVLKFWLEACVCQFMAVSSDCQASHSRRVPFVLSC